MKRSTLCRSFWSLSWYSLIYIYVYIYTYTSSGKQSSQQDFTAETPQLSLFAGIVEERKGERANGGTTITTLLTTGQRTGGYFGALCPTRQHNHHPDLRHQRLVGLGWQSSFEERKDGKKGENEIIGELQQLQRSKRPAAILAARSFPRRHPLSVWPCPLPPVLCPPVLKYKLYLICSPHQKNLSGFQNG